MQFGTSISVFHVRSTTVVSTGISRHIPYTKEQYANCIYLTSNENNNINDKHKRSDEKCIRNVSHSFLRRLIYNSFHYLVKTIQAEHDLVLVLLKENPTCNKIAMNKRIRVDLGCSIVAVI